MRAEIAFLLIATAAAGCHRAEPEAAPPHRTVRCAPAQVGTVADEVELRGTIGPPPNREAQVAAQVPGRLRDVLVREGDAVVAGQEVARLDTGPLTDEVEQAEAARAKVVAERKNADATRERTQRVFEHGIAARQEVDDAVTRAETAAAAEGEASAAARRARRQLDRAVVRSPLNGVVIRVMRRPGELVDGTPATPVLDIADPSRLELVADATAPDLVRMEKGQSAVVTVAALPGPAWRGVVVALSPAVDPATGLGVVRIALDGAAGKRPPIGLVGIARITVGASRAAVMIPAVAVRLGAGAQAEVIVCGGDGVAHVRNVSRGVRRADDEEVQGVRAGETVAVDPVIGLGDGEPIEIAR